MAVCPLTCGAVTSARGRLRARTLYDFLSGVRIGFELAQGRVRSRVRNQVRVRPVRTPPTLGWCPRPYLVGALRHTPAIRVRIRIRVRISVIS